MKRLIPVLTIPFFCVYAQEVPKVDKLKKPIQLFETRDNDGINLGLRADLLFMNYTTPVLPFVSEEVFADTNVTFTNFPVKGQGSLGCDLALTYTMKNDPAFSFEGGWYHIVTSFKNSISSPDVLPSRTGAANIAAPGNASNNSALSINFFDLFMSKSFGVGSQFSFAPLVGVIGGYMDSHITSNYVASSGSFFDGGPVSSLLMMQVVNFKGIGAKIGTAYKFDLWKWLKLSGNISYNALYGFSTSTFYQNGDGSWIVTGTDVNSEVTTYTNHHGRTFVDALIALAWQQTFGKDAFFLDLHVGWRIQSFASGWMEFVPSTNNNEHELSLFGQGVEAGISFKF